VIDAKLFLAERFSRSERLIQAYVSLKRGSGLDPETLSMMQRTSQIVCAARDLWLTYFSRSGMEKSELWCRIIRSFQNSLHGSQEDVRLYFTTELKNFHLLIANCLSYCSKSISSADSNEVAMIIQVRTSKKFGARCCLISSFFHLTLGGCVRGENVRK
jgi:hypothetical protein